MKRVLILLNFPIFTFLTYAQVSISSSNNENPQGLLDLNSSEGTSKWGMVLPKVEAVDAIRLTTSTTFPSVTTPDGAFQVVSVTDPEGGPDIKFQVPVTEAPEGTLVYDEGASCMRYKKSSTLGDWTGCIVDESAVTDNVNYNLFGGASFTMIKGSAGELWSVAIGADDKSVYTAGYGNNYRTGKGRTGNSTWSVIIGQPAVDVSAGLQHGLAALQDGSVWAWGTNSYGRTCRGTTSGTTITPQKITMPTTSKVVKVQAGDNNSLILTEDGSVYTCGRSANGLNANGSTSALPYVSSPTKVNFPQPEVIVDISLAPRAAAALTQGGKIYTWGNNNFYLTGQSADNGYTTSPAVITTNDVNIVNISSIVFKGVTMGIGNGIAYDDQNRIYTWGSDGALDGSSLLNHRVKREAFTIDAGDNIIGVACARSIDRPYFGSSNMIITPKTVYASGYNTTYNTNPGKLGVIDPNTGLAYNGNFTEIHRSSVYNSSVFTGGAIGTTHAILFTGENQVYPGSSYLSYGAGSNTYMQLGTGASAGRRIMMALNR